MNEIATLGIVFNRFKSELLKKRQVCKTLVNEELEKIQCKTLRSELE